MTDYITIADAEVEPEAPIISSLGVRWRDNAIAMMTSAPGAPRPVTIDGYFDQGGTNLLSGLSGGDLELPDGCFTGSGFSQTTTGGTSFVSAGTLTMTVRATGEIRFQANYSENADVRLTKNGVTVQTIGSGGIAGTASIDATVTSGDVIEWLVRKNSGIDATINFFRQSADDTVAEYGIYSKLSELTS